jgi:hypothetical protein
MRTGTDRFKASLARAKAAHLDTLLKDVARRRGARGERRSRSRRGGSPSSATSPTRSPRAVRLERILKGNDLSDISYLEQGLPRARRSAGSCCAGTAASSATARASWSRPACS